MTNIDLAIVVVYLAITLILGYIYGRNIGTMREYAIGKRNFPYPILVATLIATLIDSEFIFYTAAQGYEIGIFAVIIGCGAVINMLIVKCLILNIHKKFRHTISVGEIMENLYGSGSRIVTGIASTLISIVFVATQFKAISYVLHYFVNIPTEFGILLAMVITITYSCFGGIRAVTFTDLFQFYIIIGFIPIMCGYVMQHFGALPGLIEQIPSEKLSFSFTAHANVQNVFLFLSYSIPLLSPPIIQRILMAKNVRQAKKVFAISNIILVFFVCIAVFIGLTASVSNPQIDSNNAFMYIVDNYMTVGLKGFAVAGILAVIMSSSDSFMNTGSVAFAHDVLHPLCDYNLSDRTQLIVTRLATFCMGVFATLTAIIFDTILELMLYSYTFWGPIITVPLVSGIIGFKSNKISFYAGIIIGISIFLIWKWFDLENVLHFGSLIPAMTGNFIVFTTCNILINRNVTENKLP